MTFGVQVFDASSTLVWDSTTVVGGIPADVRFYAAGASGATLSYPQFAGMSAFILDGSQATAFVSLDTSAGYPVVTVSSPSVDMVFLLMVY